MTSAEYRDVLDLTCAFGGDFDPPDASDVPVALGDLENLNS
jgi:hypothetical protein